MSGLRIISGSAKGMRIQAVPGDTTRPVTDRVKESLFNILSSDVRNSTWLDLFAGTGSIGIEALSRGAQFVRFNEMNRLAIQTINTNLEITRLKKDGKVTQGDAFTLLRGTPDRAFDYIYIAPPQYKSMWSEALQMLDENPGWLSEDGWVIVQIHPVEFAEMSFTHLEEFDRRKYGSTLLLFYQLKESD
ncbi:MAG: 16S rRNA (guanine(966)-N(2))-methyltransferase RsmD [Leptolinea sp.]|jgi:16S rRNA (guanine(966)-N(2))-methyltransferase RsmD|nr:16S rRNA (guanine(966)-N(2))-methyltransferase RsmD [Leptolinea sp.]